MQGARIPSFQQGITTYTDVGFAVDQHYRKFVLYYRKTNQNAVLSALAEKVEKVYSNDWLLAHNNAWQQVVDGLESWPVDERNSQRRFFKEYVAPYIQKNLRVVVIISDALRYECGEELSRMLLAENRYEATVQGMVSGLPSYTQLGMASLLPQEGLRSEWQR
ncbi:MAG: PglZ domain-containing protein [Flavobacteriales bacterium]|nr:PglZ domain-containing protein [Flavobacteriales bacterium]